VTVVAGEVAAMIELARAATSVVVVCEPQRLSRAGELVRAIMRYYPKTRCWQLVPARPPGASQLDRIEAEAAGSWTPGNVFAVTPGFAPGISPGFTPATAAEIAAPVGGAPASAGPASVGTGGNGAGRFDAPLLTAEELEMLLGPAPESTADSDDGL
jgi:hypothetical protein